MLDSIKKKLANWWQRQVAEVNKQNQRKFKYRKVGKEEQARLTKEITETVIHWKRGCAKNSYNFFPDDTVKLVKAKTGMQLTYIGGEWFEVTRIK